MEAKRIQVPLTDEVVTQLKAGDSVLISGVVFTARDTAHKRLAQLLEQGEELPVDLKGQIIYYVGPSPARPGRIIGSAGPTTSGRMDLYTPLLLRHGVKGLIGKGLRSDAVRKALQENRALYMAATGGAGALLAKRIKAAEVVAYHELGPEAIHRFVVEDFPVTVINDSYGNDLYSSGRQRFAGE
ncbi:MAG: Fe-S-containing hydro-lyase [Firmicutes bacterium]|nr:Fe-S-containing hydro-lyase [Bacillota bacterium]